MSSHKSDPNAVHFTPTLHRRAEGRTDPKSIKYPGNFNVLITGAGKGIGIELALSYACAGASGIVITSRTKSDLDALSSQILEINKNVKVVAKVADTTKDEDFEAVAAAVSTAFDHLDVVIANAGIISRYLDAGTPKQRLPVGLMEDDSFDNVLNININGVYKTARYFMPMLLAAPEESPKAFIAMTSIACHSTNSSFVPIPYSVSKIALNRFVEILDEDHGPGKEGILAYALHPGGVMTAQTMGHPGPQWTHLLTDDPNLCGGFCTWLTNGRKEWLAGRYLAATWDVDELESMKDDIVKNDKLKFRMVL